MKPMNAPALSASLLLSLSIAVTIAAGAAGCAEEDPEETSTPPPRVAEPSAEGPTPECAPKDAPPALCSGMTWTDRAPLVATPADERLGSVTPDGLAIATVVLRQGAGGGADILVATRASTSEPFPAPSAIVGGPWADARAALSADGLRLVAIDATRRRLVELARDSKSAPFAIGPSDTFATLNAHAAMYVLEGEVYADPILSPNGLTLYYARFGTSATKTIHASHRAAVGDAWSLGAPVDGDSLSSVGGKRKIPTGVSADERTIFFLDEATGRSGASTRAAQTCGFDAKGTVDLGDRLWATPNAACDALWFNAVAAGSLDVFVEKRAR